MRLPTGVRDWLPAELVRKREIEDTLRAVFAQGEYLEVQTPSVELMETLRAGLGDRISGKVFRFDDRSGTTLALRPEMTTSIARLVATRMTDAPPPIKLSYVAHAFRYEQPQEGRMREFTQAGLEHIGPNDPDADAAVLLNALQALDAVGLADARMDINHTAVVTGVLRTLNFTSDALDAVKEFLARRDIVALDEFLRSYPTQTVDTLRRLSLARGTHALLAELEPLCRDAEAQEGVARLHYLLERLSEAGFGDRICVDFSLVRELGYYTGLVFEGYIRELGFPLCGGGRYDGLLPKFGVSMGAVGWATGIERLIIARERTDHGAFSLAAKSGK